MIIKKIIAPSAALLLLAAPYNIEASEEGRHAVFERAQAAYREGEFPQAAALYRSLVTGGELAPAVFYNMGNALYRAGDKGGAALNYRRALLMSPNLPEAGQNLRYLKHHTGFIGPETTRPERFGHLFPEPVLWWVTTVAGWGILISIAALLCLRLRELPRTIMVTTMTLSLFFAGAGVSAIITRHLTARELEGLSIVTTAEAGAHTAPARNASRVISLPPGSEVQILEQRGDWVYTSLSDGLRGWVPTSAVEPLWPFDKALVD